MKRILALILVALMCSCAMAEENAFTFRNGITWGMSQSEIEAAESAEAEIPYYDEHITLISFENTTAAGVEASTYYILYDGKLVVSGYEFAFDTISYEKLSKALKQLYGDPIETDHDKLGVIFALIGGSYDNEKRITLFEAPENTLIALMEYEDDLEVAYIAEKMIYEMTGNDPSEINVVGLWCVKSQ